MFYYIIIPAAILVAIGWIIYGIYEYKMRQEEKDQPKQISDRLKKSKSEVSDWAQKMANFESPAEQARKRKLAQQQAEQKKRNDS